MTVAWTEDANGQMTIKWTREFTRSSDEVGHDVPIAISVSEKFVAVLAACHRTQTGQVTYGLNVYWALDGTEWIPPKVLFALPGTHRPADLLIHMDDAVFITGHAAHPLTGLSTLLTVAYSLDREAPESLLPGWNPFTTTSSPVWVGLPDHELEAVRITATVSEQPGGADPDIYVLAHARLLGGRQDMFVATFRRAYDPYQPPPPPPSQPGDWGYVLWADKYGANEWNVARDIASLSWDDELGPSVRLLWVTGSTDGADGRSRIKTLQWSSEYTPIPPDPPAFPYPRILPVPLMDGWATEWDLENGLHAEGFRINFLRKIGGRPVPGGIANTLVFVAGLTKQDAQSPWMHRMLSYISSPWQEPKTPRWDDQVDSAPAPAIDNKPPVGLDVRQIP